jgi:hypothetical protein
MADTFASNAYHLFSVPVNGKTKRLSSILFDDLGSFNNASWRAYDLDGDQFDEITADNSTELQPGHAIWLRTKHASAIDIDSGSTVAVGDPYRIVLVPGWNAIASPFSFSVSWGDIKAATGAAIHNVMGVYAYDWRTKSWGDPSITDRLDPWQGYLVRNLSTEPETLLVPAYTYSGSTAKRLVKNGVKQVKLAISVPGLNPTTLTAAFGYDDGSDGFDDHDFMAPPDLNGATPASFKKSAWQNRNGNYMVDGRGKTAVGASWEFTIDEMNAERVATLKLSRPDSLPQGFSTYLVDESRQVYVKIDSVFEWLQKKDQARTFKLLVGTPGFITEHTRFLHALPLNFALFPVYPNPMRGPVTIQYAIPLLDNGATVWTHARLTVYDLSGRVITILVNDRLEPGLYSIKWDGTNQGGRKLAAGAYFLRFTAGKRFSAAQRVLMVR